MRTVASSGFSDATRPLTPGHVLALRGRDAVGTVAATAPALASADAFVTGSSHSGDEETGLSFMRTASRPTGFTRHIDDVDTVMAPESVVPSRAVPWDAEHRVLADDRRTVVFREGA